jgi:large subunit ribosomal protein L18
MGSTSKTKVREAGRLRRHRRVRRRVVGTAERPRLVIHRSSRNIQGHLADDIAGRILMGISTLAPELRADDPGRKTDRSRAAGKLLGEKARAAGYTKVVFDRGGYRYHDRVAAFAEGAREGGLEF